MSIFRFNLTPPQPSEMELMNNLSLLGAENEKYWIIGERKVLLCHSGGATK